MIFFINCFLFGSFQLTMISFINKLLLCLLFASSICYGQQVSLTGKVLDKSTEEPVPFANVFVKSKAGSNKTGTTTDFDGNFAFSCNSIQSGDSIFTSAIGYKPSGKILTQNVNQAFIFKVNRTTFDLEEVTIIAGENPAHILLRKIVENKENNNPEKLNNFHYEVYNKIEIDIHEISRKLQNNRFLKPFDFIFDNIDSTSEDKPFLPLFLTESISDYYYKSAPKKEKEVIRATKVSGINNESINQFLGKMYLDMNIYDNWISILGQNFVSPVSDHGLMYYKYDLQDSALINDQLCYKMLFKPKRKTENTFIGEIWIGKNTYAVAQVSMQIAEHCNVNFVNRVSAFQSYHFIDNKFWMMSKDKLIIEFTAPVDAPGLIGRRNISYDKFQLETEELDPIFDTKVDVQVKTGAEEKGDDFWTHARHDSLSGNEVAIYKLVDQIQNVPIYKTYVDIAQLLFTGYKVWGNIEVGPYFSFIGKDDVEGWRLKGGFRTSNQFSTNWMFGGYLAYGLKDKDFKYALETLVFIDKKPRQAIGAQYKDDLNLAYAHINEFSRNSQFSGLFRRNIPMRLVRIEEYRLYHFKEWRTGFSIETSVNKRSISPHIHNEFLFDFPSDYNGFANINDRFSTAEVGLKLRYAYQEKFVSGEFERISLGSKYPIPELNFIFGVQDLFQGDFNYQKLELGLRDKIIINPIGNLRYHFKAGKIFGTLPYLILETHRANETYYYIPSAFNNMRRYEFISDVYAQLMIDHHFRGFLLDKIPLMKKLKWRSLLTAKSAIGSLSRANQKANELNNLNTLSRKPYVEAGVGIENILKFIRIDGVWRLTYLDLPNANKFGIRGSIQFDF